MKNLAAKTAFVVLTALVLAGCVHGNVAPSESAASGTDAYFIMGISNDKTRVGISAGTSYHATFNATNNANVLSADLAYEGVSHDGYIVGKVPAGMPLGLVFLQTDDDALFSPCMIQEKAATQTLVFNAGAGQVVYIVDVEMDRYHDKLMPVYHRDLEAARAFLATHYPNLTGSLEMGSYEMLQTKKC